MVTKLIGGFWKETVLYFDFYVGLESYYEFESTLKGVLTNCGIETGRKTFGRKKVFGNKCVSARGKKTSPFIFHFRNRFSLLVLYFDFNKNPV